MDYAQFALTVFLYVAGAIWAISAWRTRSERTISAVPELERRVGDLEEQRRVLESLPDLVRRVADVEHRAREITVHDRTLQEVKERVEHVAVHDRTLQEVKARVDQVGSLDRTLQDLKVRIEQVAVRSHEAINQIAALPRNLGSEFLRREVGELGMRESAEDRSRLHREIEVLRTDLDALRRYVNTRGAARRPPPEDRAG